MILFYVMIYLFLYSGYLESYAIIIIIFFLMYQSMSIRSFFVLFVFGL